MKDGNKLTFFAFSDRLNGNSLPEVTVKSFNLIKTSQSNSSNSTVTADSNTFTAPIQDG